MERDRLKTVQQTDLTESRINQDFLIWLKEKGINYLLLVVIGCCAWVLWVNWRQKVDTARDDAWLELQNAGTPAALSEVASKHAEVDSVSVLARLELADMYLQAIQSNRRFDVEPNSPDASLSPDKRLEYLTEADRLYREVAESVGTNPENFAMKIFTINALFGRAAVAESEAKYDEAKRFLEDAAAAARPEYTGLKETAEKRIESLAWLAKTPPLPAQAEVAPDPNPQSAPPALLDDLIDPSQAAPAETPMQPILAPGSDDPEEDLDE